MPTGGSIKSVTIDGRSFAVAADADAGRSLGGDQNEVQPNGNNTARLIKTVLPWTISDIAISIDDALGDQEFIQGIIDKSGFVPVVITYASGRSYNGSGQITGEPVAQSQATTMALTIMGSGKLKPQQ